MKPFDATDPRYPAYQEACAKIDGRYPYVCLCGRTDCTEPLHIEVPAEDAPYVKKYVKKCIELHNAGKVNLDEFEFRDAKSGDKCLAANGSIFEADDAWGNKTVAFVQKSAKEPVSKTLELAMILEAEKEKK